VARTIIVGRRQDRARALAEALRAEGVAAEAASDPAVVAEADIVTTVTTSATPVFPGAALRPGTHVNLGGAFRPDGRESDDSLARRGCRTRTGRAACLARAGDLVMPLASGALDPARVIGEIGAALAGELRGRTDAGEITVFKSLGNAAQDICLAEDALALPGLAAPEFDPCGEAG
jgi:ornithine cyclodeaminase